MFLINKTGPAWNTAGGTVRKVEGNIYKVEDYEGNQVKLHIGQGKKHINKNKVGDTVRAEITLRRLREFHSVNPHFESAHQPHARWCPCTTARHRVIETTPSPISERQYRHNRRWPVPWYCPYRS